MSKFVVRTSCPGNYDKNYMRTANGGWNTCIQGYPCKADANVLANCVGYASGRFNEIINIVKDIEGCTYRSLNCNAENFVERAVNAGLEIGNDPRVGAIMCWQDGSLSSGDGAGHVAIVEKVIDNNTVYTSESSYSGSYFFNATRKRNSGNGWGIGGKYKFRNFIYLPKDVQELVDGSTVVITPNVDRDETKDQIEVKVEQLRVRADAGTDKPILGFSHVGYYNYYESKEATGYVWYRIAEGQWIASKDEWTTVLPAKEPEPKKTNEEIAQEVIDGKWGNNPERKERLEAAGYDYYAIQAIVDEMLKPTPTPSELQEGDTVQIIGTGWSNAYGTKGWAAGGIGWTRTVQKVMRDQNGNLTAFPYKVGNSTGTTGFYKASSLKKI